MRHGKICNKTRETKKINPGKENIKHRLLSENKRDLLES